MYLTATTRQFTTIMTRREPRLGSYKGGVEMTESFNTTKHGHLSLTFEEMAMTILVISVTSENPMVKYGAELQDLVFDATWTSTTYSARYMQVLILVGV